MIFGSFVSYHFTYLCKDIGVQIRNESDRDENNNDDEHNKISNINGITNLLADNNNF